MTSKEYDTLQPIPSQAERELSFLDASMEVTDFSNSQNIKTTKRLRKRPWFSFKMNMTGRVMQTMTILTIAIAGFIFGLLILKIPLRTSNIYLLFRHGYISEAQGIQLNRYEGTVLEGPHNQFYFKVQGKIFNFEKQFMPQRDFALNLYTQDLQILGQHLFSCCKKEFYPQKITSIEEVFPIPSGQVGYYQLKLY